MQCSFFLTRPDFVVNTSVSDPISDHCCVTVYLHIPASSRTVSKRPYTMFLPDVEHADWSGMRGALSAAPLLEAMQGTQNVDAAWSAWQGVFLEILYQHVPLKPITIRPNNKVWKTSALHKLSQQKHRLFAAAKRSGTTTTWQAYQQTRNLCNIAFKKAKSTFMKQQQDKLSTLADGSSVWWRKAKALARISAPTEQISNLTSNGQTLTQPKEKADALAKYFAQQCTAPATDKYTFSPAKLSSERGEKEVLADSNQPTAPPSTKSHVSYCAARARRREKMAAEGTSSMTE